MDDELSWPAVLAWRVQRQGLAQRVPAAQWPAVVRSLCGLHAQVHSSAELTLWARVDGIEKGFLDGPLWTARTLVKTWAMRGTLHLLDAGDLTTFAGAQGALPARYDSASWRKAFGMSTAEAEAVLDAIRDALDGEPLLREMRAPCSMPTAASASTARRAGCRRCCSSTGVSRAFGAMSSSGET